MRVRGIAEAPRDRWEPGTPELLRVRPGHHDGDDGGELHLVLDLAGANVRIESGTGGDELSLRLTRP